MNSEQPHGARLGYMGHISLLAITLQTVFSVHIELLSHSAIMSITEDEDWIEFCTRTLKENRSQETCILGGEKPERHPGSNPAGLDQDSSQATENAISGSGYIMDQSSSRTSSNMTGMGSLHGSLQQQWADAKSEEGLADDYFLVKMGNKYKKHHLSKEADQLARYIIHQVTRGLPNRLGEDHDAANRPGESERRDDSSSKLADIGDNSSSATDEDDEGTESARNEVRLYSKV